MTVLTWRSAKFLRLSAVVKLCSCHPAQATQLPSVGVLPRFLPSPVTLVQQTLRMIWGFLMRVIRSQSTLGKTRIVGGWRSVGDILLPEELPEKWRLARMAPPHSGWMAHLGGCTLLFAVFQKAPWHVTLVLIW